MSTLTKVPLVVGLSLFVACGGHAISTETPAPEEPVVEVPALPAPGDDAAAARTTELAHRALSETAEAVGALEAEDVDRGRGHLVAALTALDEIESTEPSIHVARFLATAAATHQIDEDVPVGPDDVVAWSSLTRELDLASLPESVREARSAIESGEDTSLGDLELVGSYLHLHAIALPLASTHVKLLAAKELVDQHKIAKALDVLDTATLDVRLVDAWVDAPVWQARAEVQQARNALADGDVAGAQARLDAAAPLLEAVQLDPEATPHEAALALALQEEVGTLGRALAAGRVDEAKRGLAGVEHRVWAMNQRWSARRTAARQRGQERDALADALDHVEWAFAYQFEDGTPEKAARMRERANEDLARAFTGADAASRPVLARIQRDLDVVRNTPVSGQDDATRLAFAQLALDLRAQIYDLGGEV